MSTFTIIVTEKGGSQQRIEFDEEVVTVGRVQGNQIVLPRGNVSKKHAKLEYSGGEFRLTDLNSTNGTYINGRRITETTLIKKSDSVYVGEFILAFESAPSELAPAPPPIPASPRHKMPPPPSREAKIVDDEAPEHSTTLPPEDEIFSSSAKESPPRAPRPPAPPRPKAPAPAPAKDSSGGGDRMEQMIDVLARQVKRVERGSIPVKLDEGTAGKIRLILKDLARDMVASGKLSRTGEMGDLLGRVFRAVVDLGPLSNWLEDPAVHEIRIVRSDSIWLRKSGAWSEAPVGFTSEESLAEILKCLGAGLAWRDDEGVPGLVRFRLEDGPLVLAAMSPVCSGNPTAAIYKNISASLLNGANLDMMSEDPAREVIEKGIEAGSRFAVVGAVMPYRLSVLTDMVRLIPSSAFLVGVEDLDIMGFCGPGCAGLTAGGSRKGAAQPATVGSLLLRANDLSPDWIVSSTAGWVDIASVMACATNRRGMMAELPLSGEGLLDEELAAAMVAGGVPVTGPFAANLLVNAFELIVIVGSSGDGKPEVRKILRTGVIGDEWSPKTVFKR